MKKDKSYWEPIPDTPTAGLWLEPYDPNLPTYNFRDLMAYAKKVNKKPIDLTDEEREQFRTN